MELKVIGNHNPAVQMRRVRLLLKSRFGLSDRRTERVIKAAGFHVAGVAAEWAIKSLAQLEAYIGNRKQAIETLQQQLRLIAEDEQSEASSLQLLPPLPELSTPQRRERFIRGVTTVIETDPEWKKGESA